MHIEYEISEQDFMNAQRLAIKNSPVLLVRLTRWVMPAFGLAGLVFIANATIQQGFSWRVIPALAFCLLLISLPLLSKRTQKKLYINTSSIHGKLSVEVEEDSLAFTGPTFSSKVDWSNFWKAFEDEQSFLIYQQNRQVFNIIPKRSLSTQQVSELREYLARKLPSKS